ncbi:MAG TPA: class I SAM-dependent methyltransferase [Rubrobacter sp.]|nr:class I SAM-dependent methyltransferase [Rubrobacter sp.]
MKRGGRRYSEITIRDKNPVKRYLQRRRLRDAISVLDGLDEHFCGSFLDFGGGSGELSKILAKRYPSARVFCYEPMPGIFEEARQNLSELENVMLVSDRKELRGLAFEYVFCLEVFEHLPRRQTARTIKTVDRLLKENGVFVVGVPNELFVPAFIKGLFRMKRRYGTHDARLGNILRAAIGRPPAKRPVRMISEGLPYHFHHLGFDHRRLRTQLSETFDPVREFGSPIRNQLLSTEVYFVLVKR